MKLPSNKELKRRSLELIKKEGLYTLADVYTRLGISKKSFFSHKINQDKKIIDAIWEQKIKVKSELRKKWEVSNNPTLQLCLYKMLADEDELRVLTVSTQKVEGEIKTRTETGSDKLDLTKLTDEELKTFEQLTDKARIEGGTGQKTSA